MNAVMRFGHLGTALENQSLGGMKRREVDSPTRRFRKLDTSHRASLKRIQITQIELCIIGPLLRDVGDGSAVTRNGRIRGDFLTRRKRDR